MGVNEDGYYLIGVNLGCDFIVEYVDICEVCEGEILLDG